MIARNSDSQNRARPNQQQLEDKEAVEEYDSFLYRFQQQIISAWKPVPHASNNVILYLVLSIICLTLGIVMLLTTVSTQEIQLRYDQTCAVGSACSLTFTLKEDLEQPVYFYYGLKGYYQNHRRYIKYYSTTQMNGKQIDLATAQTDCGKFATNEQCGYTVSQTGAFLTKSDVAFPCGARGRSFNQIRPELNTFVIKYANNGTNVTWSNKNIAWSSDKTLASNDWDISKQPFSLTDQDWLVWFRPAARSDFYKLFRRIEQNMPAGEYKIQWTNYFSSPFGEKWFFLSRSNYLGNHDYFLGIAFTCLGGICLILLLVFIAKWVTQRRAKVKDP